MSKSMLPENPKKTELAPKPGGLQGVPRSSNPGNQHRHFLITGGLLAGMLLAGFYWLAVLDIEAEPESIEQVKFGDVTVNVEVAETPAQRSRGLSNRPELPEGHGMLFVFDEPDFYRFHMLDMRFAIDMIWLGSNLEVVDTTRNFTPESYPDTVTSERPVQYVLEVNAGFIERHGIVAGDSAEFISP